MNFPGFTALAIALPMLLTFTPIAMAASTTRPALAAGPVEKDGLEVTLAGDKTAFANNEPDRPAGPGRRAGCRIEVREREEAPYWMGKVTTKGVPVEIAEPPAEPPPAKAATAPDDERVGALESFKG